MILSAIAEKLVQWPRRCAVGHRKRVSRIIGLDLIPRLLGSRRHALSVSRALRTARPPHSWPFAPRAAPPALP